MSVLIKGGRVVTASDSTIADVYIEGERVSLIGSELEVEADTVIDANGKLVLPGAIDPHTHLDMPFGGTVTIDDVTSGQTAAAWSSTNGDWPIFAAHRHQTGVMVNGLLPRQNAAPQAAKPGRGPICTILRKSAAYSLRIWAKTKPNSELALQAFLLGSTQIR